MPKFNLDKLPQTIKVKIEKTSEGKFIAELSDLQEIFTQADNLELLEFSVNDLIRAYFDVPKEYQPMVWYKPSETKSEADTIKTSSHYQILLAKNFHHQWH